MASATTSPQSLSTSVQLPRNRKAGRLIASWRIDQGLSPEALSWKIAERGLGYISGRQIRRIETEGVIPTPRTMFAIAKFFEQTPSKIWFAPGGRR